MKNRFGFAFLFCLMNAILLKAQVPDWEWVRGAGINCYACNGFGVCTDNSGYTYMSGNIRGTGSFGSFTINTGGNGFVNFVLVKYDQSGNVVWAKKIASPLSGTLAGVCKTISTDNNGYLYVAGSFKGNILFGSDTINSNVSGIFTAKFDTSANLLWVSSVDFSAHSEISSVSLDSFGNSFITGFFVDTGYFATDTLINYGMTDVFVAKYNLSGNLIWVKQAGGVSSDVSNSITTDINGNSYITGVSGSSISSFGTCNLNCDTLQIFIVKYDTSGNVVWARNAGGLWSNSAKGISVNGNSLFIIGQIAGPVVFGGNNFIGSGNSDSFLAKYDTAGNYIWLKLSGGSGEEMGEAIFSDNLGYCFVTGKYNNSTSFEGDTLIAHGPNTSPDVFVAKYRMNGDFIWVRNGGSKNNDWANSISANSYGDCFITGMKDDSAWFGNIYVPANIADAGFYFTAKIGCNTLPPTISVVDNNLNSSFGKTYQWYFNGTLIIGANSQSYNPTMNGDYTVEIVDNYGCRVMSAPYTITQVGIKDIINNGNLSVSPNPSTGIFMFNINNGIDAIGDIEIQNILGKSILKTKKTTVSLEKFSNGLYTYLVYMKSGKIYSGKIMKQ